MGDLVRSVRAAGVNVYVDVIFGLGNYAPRRVEKLQLLVKIKIVYNIGVAGFCTKIGFQHLILFTSMGFIFNVIKIHKLIAIRTIPF
jgi:hypothetical protein